MWRCRNNFPTSSEVQRVMERLEIRALLSVLRKICGTYKPRNKDEVDCISAGHQDVDLWILVGARSENV